MLLQHSENAEHDPQHQQLGSSLQVHFQGGKRGKESVGLLLLFWILKYKSWEVLQFFIFTNRYKEFASESDFTW